MRERLNWLDSMRGLAFLMVIYYHLSTRSAGGIVLYFTPVFLTAFFFVSDYLTKSGMPFGKVLEQRTRTLFVPLLISLDALLVQTYHNNIKPLLFIGTNSWVYFALHRQVMNAVDVLLKKIMVAFSLEPSLFSNQSAVVVIATLIFVPV